MTHDAGSSATGKIVKLADGWVRCSITAKSNAATAGQRIIFQLYGSTGYYMTGDGVSGNYVWGAQFEVGGMTSFIQNNTGSSKTLQAERHLIDGTYFSGFYSAEKGAFAYEFTQDSPGYAIEGLMSYSDGTADEIVELYALTNGTLVSRVVAGGDIAAINCVDVLGQVPTPAETTFFVDFRDGMPGNAVFSRPGPKGYYDESGMWQVAKADEPVIVNGKYIYDPLKTNYNDDEDLTQIQQVNTTVTLATDLSPTGVPMYVITDSDAGDDGYVKTPNIAAAQDELWSAHVCILKDAVARATRYIRLQLSFGGSLFISGAINLDTSTGEYDEAYGGNYDPNVKFRVEDRGDYWWLAVTAANTYTGNNTVYAYIYPADGNGEWVPDDAVTGSCSAWHLQLEKGYPTPFISTSGGPGARLADKLYFDSTGILAAENTFFVDKLKVNTDLGAWGLPASGDNNIISTKNNTYGSIMYFSNLGDFPRLRSYDGTNFPDAGLGGAISPDDEFSAITTASAANGLRIAYSKNGADFVIDDEEGPFDGAFDDFGEFGVFDNMQFSAEIGVIGAYNVDYRKRAQQVNRRVGVTYKPQMPAYLDTVLGRVPTAGETTFSHDFGDGLPPGAVFSRPGPKSYLDEFGKFMMAAEDEPVIVNGQYIYDPQSTNDVPYTDLTLVTGDAVVSIAGTMPDGQTGYTVNDNDAGNFLNIRSTYSTDLSGDEIYSTFIKIEKDAIGKAIRYPALAIRYTGTVSADCRVLMDTSTGELAIFETFAGDILRYGVLDLTDYWVLYLTAKNTQANTDRQAFFYPAFGANATLGNNTGASITGACNVWHFQFEPGAMSAYIPTSGLPETRLADVLYVAYPDFPQYQGTMYVRDLEFNGIQSAVGGNSGIVSLSESAFSLLRVTSSDQFAAYYSYTASSATTPVIDPDAQKHDLALSWRVGEDLILSESEDGGAHASSGTTPYLANYTDGNELHFFYECGAHAKMSQLAIYNTNCRNPQIDHTKPPTVNTDGSVTYKTILGKAPRSQDTLFEQDFIGGLRGDAVFSRAGSKHYYKAGILTEVPDGEPLIYNGKYIYDPQKTNYFKEWRDFTNGALYIGSNAYVSTSGVADTPDGFSAGGFHVNDASSTHFMRFIAPDADTQTDALMTTSFLIKQDGAYPDAQIRLQSSSGWLENYVFDITLTGAGTIVNTGNNSDHFGIEAFPDGWYRVWCSGMTTAVQVARELRVYAHNGVGISFAGDDASGYAISDIQIEVGTMTGPIPCEDNQIETRLRDDLSYPLSTLDQDAGTLVVDDLLIKTEAGTAGVGVGITTNAGIVTVNSSAVGLLYTNQYPSIVSYDTVDSSAESIESALNGGDYIRAMVAWESGSSLDIAASIDGAAWIADDSPISYTGPYATNNNLYVFYNMTASAEMGFVGLYSQNYFSEAMPAVEPDHTITLPDVYYSTETDAEVMATFDATIPTVDRVYLGEDAAGNHLNGHVKSAIFFQKDFTEAQLQALVQ